MTAPEVQFVLNATRDHYPTGESLAAIPLERIDRDNSNNLDANRTHEVSEDLEGMNYISASLVDRPDEPLGTEYDLMGEAVVSVRVEGMHVDEFGAIDPGTGSEVNVSHNTTTWDALTDNVRRALLNDTSRKFPQAGRTNTSYTDMRIVPGTWNDQAQNFGDYYLLTFDVALHGFEELP